MAVRNAQFYAIWPVTGKYMNFQWGNERQNTAESKAQVRAAVLDVQDSVDILNARKAVAGREYGELDFQKRWRSFYDKDEDRFKVQRNTGTQASPTWTDVAEFSDDTGAMIHTGPSATFSGTVFATGGFSSAGGFYGINHPQELAKVQEWPSKGTVVTTVTDLNFNEEHFYITTVRSSGQPIVNVLNKDFGIARRFNATTGLEWQINHNFNTVPVMATAYDGLDRVVSPYLVDVSDPNTTYFYWNSSQDGYAFIATGGTGAVSLRPNLNISQLFYFGSEVFENVSAIHFESQEFYLTTASDSAPIVNLRGTRSGHRLIPYADGIYREIMDKKVTSQTHEIINNVNLVAYFKKTAWGTDGAEEISLTTTMIPFTGIRIYDESLSTAGFPRTINASGRDNDFIVYSTSAVLLHSDAGLHRVGIGTQSPSQLLDVNGDARVRGALLVTGKASKVVADGFYITQGGQLVDTASNLSGDEGIYASKADGTIRFKSLTAGSNVTLTSDDNAITIASSGGGGGTGGFYGVVWNDGTTVRRTDRLHFNSAQFYLSGYHPVLNLITEPGRSNVFAASGAEWQINHGYGSPNVLVQVMDNQDRVVLPQVADLSDPNTAYFYFITPLTGKVRVSAGGAGAATTTVRQTDGLASFGSITQLSFEAASFYITQNASGDSNEAIVNFRGSAGSSGEVNTASNLSGDEGIFSSKSGVDLRFKSLTAGSNVTLASDANAITISSTPTPGFYGITVKQSDDAQAFRGINTLAFHTGNFYLEQSATNLDEVVVNLRNAGGGGSGEVNTASNLAGDEGIFASKSGVDLRFKSLTAGSNITLASDANAITISATAGSSARHNIVTARGFYGSFGEFGTSRTDLNSLNGNTKDLSWDWDAGNVFHLPIRRPMTIHTPSNLPSGCQVVNLVTVNDGFYSITWGSKFIFPGGNQIDATQGANKVDLWSMIYNPTIDRIIVTKAADCFY